MKQKLLIFGASGFVGPYLASEFKENGYEIFGSDRAIPTTQFNFPFYEADITNTQEVNKVIHTVLPDMIINLAAISSVGQSWEMPQLTMDINVIGALNILEAARSIQPMTKVMFIGSSEEYVISNYPLNENQQLNASNPYGISKITQEQFAKLYREQYGLKIYYVRPFNHTGIGQRDSFVLPSFCKQVAEIEKTGKPGIVYVGNLNVKRDFSHVKDIVRAYRMIAESTNCETVYNVGSGKAYSLAEILCYIVSLSNQEITIEVDPYRFRPSDQPVICCDYTRIKNDLGWEPEYDIKQALNEMYQYYLRKM